eukprot:CAMPEP_0180679432 /NCGR_PEP_ID=MMETSP1037_2-20121125/68921_1 /TAXON_ID=632150 /ORGANISM="Azadinium spinosum, Strain 3D9" /LENGTH=97 /DNA_ID=CAMNT_0022709159 /DNA_START=198 /DNA_END=488 /DNA_ORIENTATION=+
MSSLSAVARGRARAERGEEQALPFRESLERALLPSAPFPFVRTRPPPPPRSVEGPVSPEASEEVTTEPSSSPSSLSTSPPPPPMADPIARGETAQRA